jgi:hypothetical protein
MTKKTPDEIKLVLRLSYPISCSPRESLLRALYNVVIFVRAALFLVLLLSVSKIENQNDR